VATATGAALAVGNGLTLTLPASAAPDATGVISVALRPEKIALAVADGNGAARANAEGTVESSNFLGGAVLYRIALTSGLRVLAQQPNSGASRPFAAGSRVRLDWNPADLVILKD